MNSISCTLYFIVDINVNDSIEMEQSIRDIMRTIKNLPNPELNPQIKEARGDLTSTVFINDEQP